MGSVDEIRHAAIGLMYPSESDYPLDVVTFPPSATSARDALKEIIDRRGHFEEVESETFWKELDGVEGAQGFANLRRVMQASLTNLSVLRIGEPEIDVYLLGQTKSGEWIGVHTVSVET